MSEESKRCRNIRRVLIFLFIVCGYMLSTTFAVDVIEIDGVETVVSMTALNLAFGAMGGSVPVRQNTPIGMLYIILPVVGFFFMFFDKKTNIKNIVGICCGMIGMTSIFMFINFNIGIGALVSILCYILIDILSVTAMFMHLQDSKTNSKPRTLKGHL